MTDAISISNAQLRFGETAALDGVSLAIPQGTCFGIVGESGSGKTTLMRAVLGLQKLDQGEIRILGNPLVHSRAALKQRASFIQPIFQDPAASLSPRSRIRTLMNEVGTVLREPHGAMHERLGVILNRLGLPPGVIDKYPHEISGGQARRVAIARALLMKPSILIADEPTAGLDVSVQGDLLNLLQDIRRSDNITLVVISHNLAIVRLIAENAVVMRAGKVVEGGEAGSLFKSPREAYTRELLAAWPGVTQSGVSG
ncbi:ABC transporter ATP-binding protein [Mesorhizobium sp. M7D.F.Ca.US.005.01.1.1]|uniref:ABC transporter ATP-binding protein n=1 Tax=Mesorhizobium sp. M7D.F.Ca.US.005.01.1.1 TaxID=2493678 RepID=UPI000F763F18|nr:dipeptide/oligopeptide/nickel ABC transporter ATP-binding protein [Mesorhizobium sp. M7D.F.Ca.US.005.01.1.1]AZO44502.1 ABC transporter ATP-binding protein [Mesorhizobium sp. M7D.F.Ca.US.005.01.1.1]